MSTPTHDTKAHYAATESLLGQLLPNGLTYDIDGHIITGHADTSAGRVRLLGTVHGAAMNHQIAIRLADEILALIADGDKTPVVFVVDTQGQDLSRADELLCLNHSFAHLASCVELLRVSGYANLAIIFGQAVSGGFLSYGLMANEVYAFDDSQVKVMDLNAMARVTKIPVERLQSLSQTSAIFAPGVENYYKMGAIKDIWTTPVTSDVIGDALARQQADISAVSMDKRRTLAQERQGRQLCADIVQAVLSA
ncbi:MULTISPECIES: biotin-independent malonate decarboxylase subunit gamma [Moraxella]|uniref:Malonate decarboxylase gamma subunit n=1 Tax=Moraxella catarrhalis TaxID=480 RepID=A0A7Z0UZF2_MORCA|nr:biotin-independent malonate decarboxylase subunit gamma [Moraxella catarrhalis]OAV01592.1 Malonate decarboxylase gamma subunit [Moraxella catarrhalis]STY82674.1 malonate decarboxylase, gamma subunit [Moraxella catarrhalis]